MNRSFVLSTFWSPTIDGGSTFLNGDPEGDWLRFSQPPESAEFNLKVVLIGVNDSSKGLVEHYGYALFYIQWR